MPNESKYLTFGLFRAKFTESLKNCFSIAHWIKKYLKRFENKGLDFM